MKLRIFMVSIFCMLLVPVLSTAEEKGFETNDKIYQKQIKEFSEIYRSFGEKITSKTFISDWEIKKNIKKDKKKRKMKSLRQKKRAKKIRKIKKEAKQLQKENNELKYILNQHNEEDKKLKEELDKTRKEFYKEQEDFYQKEKEIFDNRQKVNKKKLKNI